MMHLAVASHQSITDINVIKFQKMLRIDDSPPLRQTKVPFLWVRPIKWGRLQLMNN